VCARVRGHLCSYRVSVPRLNYTTPIPDPLGLRFPLPPGFNSPADPSACDTTPSTCPNLCDYIVYTATVTCFNCLVGNSAPDVNATTLSTMLHDVGDMCEGVGHSLLSFGRVTAKPTATGEMVRFDLGAAVTAMPWTWTRTGDGARNNQPTGVSLRGRL